MRCLGGTSCNSIVRAVGARACGFCYRRRPPPLSSSRSRRRHFSLSVILCYFCLSVHGLYFSSILFIYVMSPDLPACHRRKQKTIKNSRCGRNNRIYAPDAHELSQKHKTQLYMHRIAHLFAHRCR